MTEVRKGQKDDIVKDSVSRLIKGSETAALQAVDSTTAILRAGLDSAEELSEKAGGLLLNNARRVLNVGNILAGEVCAMTKELLKGTAEAASEVGDEVKGAVGSIVGKNTTAVKSKEKVE
jgi:hypothetical protein